MINKHFKIISVFELQTRDQFNWFALQFEKNVNELSIFVFQSNELKSIDLLFIEKLILKTQWADIDNNEKMKRLKMTRHLIFLKKFLR